MGVAAVADRAASRAWSAAPATPARTGSRFPSPADHAEALAQRLLAQPGVLPAGLGARDSLRLEAGLCLYGNDIDELTTPVEAGLAWAIGKRRRDGVGLSRAPRAIREQLENGPHRLRVGIRPGRPRAGPRPDARSVAPDGTGAGERHLRRLLARRSTAPIAMGYVAPRPRRRRHRAATCMVRGKPLPARVAPLPFVPHRYAR